MYLGVIVLRKVSDYMSLNLMPVLQDLRLKLKAWHSLPLSLLGCINLIKIKILPKFNYLFCNFPQWIPKSFFSQLTTMLSSFLWESQYLRYTFSALTRPLLQGGLSISDLNKDFLSLLRLIGGYVPTFTVLLLYWRQLFFAH